MTSAMQIPIVGSLRVWQRVFICLIILLATFPTNRILAKPKPLRYESVGITQYQDSCLIKAGKLKIVITQGSNELYIDISENGQVHKRFTECCSSLQYRPDSALLADINGDGRLDVKLFFGTPGASPLAAMVKRKLYFISLDETRFSKISFTDFSQEPEYDFNADGNFEIVSKELVAHQNHSYWKFELYSLSHGKLVNCSNRYNYPRVVRFLKNGKGRPAYVRAITTKTSREPREFSQQF